MADQRSVKLLAFNFASRTFAYRRLGQGLSRALSAFSSFMREYLDSVIRVDQCAQYVDDIGIAANTTEQLIKNIRAVFKCIERQDWNWPSKKGHFGVTQIKFLGRTITPDGVAPQDQKVKKFLSKVRFPKSKKRTRRTSEIEVAHIQTIEFRSWWVGLHITSKLHGYLQKSESRSGWQWGGEPQTSKNELVTHGK